MTARATLEAHVDRDLPTTLEDLRRLVAIPSVAAQRRGIREAAEAVAALLRAAGGAVTVLEHGGANPVVAAEFAGRSAKTLLFYDHYDVQPADPVDEWTVPPFDLTQRDGLLLGRGVADNKGDLLTRIAAIRAITAVDGGLPCRIKFVIEGEEEIGSVNFGAVVRAHAKLLAADACVWEYAERDSTERLHMVCGCKGICYLELEACVGHVDLHSMFGALVEGAPFRLVHALHTFKDERGTVLIPGHYDRVRRPTAEETEAVQRIPLDVVEDVRRQFEPARLLGEVDGPNAVRQLFFAPTCTICGIWGGYTQEGQKTVLPRAAHAKVDFRLVPDQDPHEVARSVRKHLDVLGYTDISLTVLAAEFPWRTDLSDPFVRLSQEVVEESTGRTVIVSPTSAGTGPRHDLAPLLKVPVVSIGAGYWKSRSHAPDESLRLSDFRETVLMLAHLMYRFGAQ
ncbi:MAG TPA: M20/M25/M40 family metallo-hydrolase [bacterium]|nr:M20/M25/M40 family metallo-hydrolase [bacterium]